MSIPGLCEGFLKSVTSALGSLLWQMRSHWDKLFRSCFQKRQDVTEIVEDLYFPHSHTYKASDSALAPGRRAREGCFPGPVGHTLSLVESAWACCHHTSASFVFKSPEFLVALVAFTLEELFIGKGFPSGNLSFLIHKKSQGAGLWVPPGPSN